PSTLYQRLKKRAEQAERSVEDEMLEMLASYVPDGNELPAETQEALASLNTLNDESLGRAAENRLAAELSAELEMLHFKQQREGLSHAEAARCAELVRAYEKAMLIRAQAAVLLKKRGFDVTHLVAVP